MAIKNIMYGVLAQLVERWLRKSKVVGSIPICSTKKLRTSYEVLNFFYPSRQAWYITMRQRVYHQRRQAAFVSHHTFRCVSKNCRLDDIQNFVSMICNSCGIDAIRAKPVIPRRDIQGFALIVAHAHDCNFRLCMI